MSQLQQTQATDIQEEQIIMSIVESTSEKLQDTVRSPKIRFTFYAENALCKLLCKAQDRVAVKYKNTIVYEIDCSNCEVVYLVNLSGF